MTETARRQPVVDGADEAAELAREEDERELRGFVMHLAAFYEGTDVDADTPVGDSFNAPVDDTQLEYQFFLNPSFLSPGGKPKTIVLDIGDLFGRSQQVTIDVNWAGRAIRSLQFTTVRLRPLTRQFTPGEISKYVGGALPVDFPPEGSLPPSPNSPAEPIH